MGKKQKKEYKFLLKSNPLDSWNCTTEIGDGSFGKVYMAEKKDKSIVSACKVCAIDSEMDMDDMAQEVHILLTCDSQYILKAYEAYYYDQKIHMFLELCNGGGLDDVIMDFESGLPEPFIQSIMYQMIHALCYLHQKGIIHRDIKAGNMLLTESGLVKLADFGVSGVNTHPNQKRSTFIGTPYWMAPEVIITETHPEIPYCEKCDVWSMGITCIELGEAQPPYNDQHPMCVMFVIIKNPPPTFTNPEKWSDTFKDFTSRCLSFDAKGRASAAELLQHIFLQITEAKSKADVRELYRVYKDCEVEEIEIDIESSCYEIDKNQKDDSQSLSQKPQSSLTSLMDSRLNMKSDMSINETAAAGVQKSPSQNDKKQLKTVRKTRRFNVDGQVRTETVVTVVDENRKGILQKEIKFREACMNEMKRLRRQEATELEKKREIFNAKIDEMEKVHFVEKQKMLERIKYELDCVENSQTKEFAKKESTLYEEQKKFLKKLKSDHDKEVKQIKKSSKKADSSFQNLRERISVISEKHKDEYGAYIAKQSTELTKIKHNLLNHKHQQAKNLEGELWALESRQILELNELHCAKHKDLSILTFWQVIRRFKKELAFLQERTEFKMEETLKKQLLEIKELPKIQKAEMKLLLELEKKNYRKQVKHGLTTVIGSEKEYLKSIFDEKYKQQTKQTVDFKQEQLQEKDKIKEQFNHEKSEIIFLMENKQREIYRNSIETQLAAEIKAENSVRSWLSELLQRKNDLLANQTKELQSYETINMKISADWIP